MKKIFAFVLIVSAIFGCQTEFSVNGENEEIPIVHCLLDPNNDIHFLKVNKTFLGDGNANEFAMVADSSYFDKVVSTIEEYNGGFLTRVWTSDPAIGPVLDSGGVDYFRIRDTVIQNKEPGAFYYPEQKLYYFKASDLQQDALYRLHLEIDNGKHIVRGETELVKNISIDYPYPVNSLVFAEANVPANGYRTQSIRFSPGTGVVFKAQVNFQYRESTPSGTETKSILWDIGTLKAADITTNNPSFSANGEVFYEIVGNSIEGNPDVIRRTPLAFELIVTAGSEDLNTYMLVNEPTSGLAQNKPTFTNLEGGLGIFSSRTTVTQYKLFEDPGNTNYRGLNVNSTRELCIGQYTNTLKFCSNHNNDIASGYSFACN